MYPRLPRPSTVLTNLSINTDVEYEDKYPKDPRPSIVDGILSMTV